MDIVSTDRFDCVVQFVGSALQPYIRFDDLRRRRLFDTEEAGTKAINETFEAGFR